MRLVRYTALTGNELKAEDSRKATLLRLNNAR